MPQLSPARLFAIVCYSAAILALLSGRIANAVTDTIFQYKTPKTGYFTISPEALAPENSDGAKVYLNAPNLVRPTFGNAVCMVSGVNLPNGALIKALTAWVSSDVDRGVQIELFRNNPATGQLTAIDEVESHDSTQTRGAIEARFVVGAAPTVNNQHFNYSFVVCLETSNSIFYGGRITYSYSDAGD